MLRTLLVAVLALVVGAFVPQTSVTTPPRAAIDARSAAVTMQADFFDAGLDNPAIAEDKNAQPARKCASCFG